MATQDPDGAELEAERAYLAHAYRCLEAMRELVAHASEAAVGETARDYLIAWSQERLQTLFDAERGLCFGRLDFEDGRPRLYVGRRLVYDDGQHPVVINWQAPAARPFYTASPAVPQGVLRRRRFQTEGRELLGFSDELVSGSEEDGSTPVFDPLLEELNRERSARMRDIVATIQADQYGLITRPLAGILVVQGGPGTGKTAIGLHRASWLLYTHHRELARRGLLVVGPNPAFMKYVSQVLPALGEDAVEQRAVSDLVDGRTASGCDPKDAARLKGDARLAEVISRAVAQQAELPGSDLEVFLDRTTLRVRAAELAELVAAAATGPDSYARARERLRTELHRRLYADYGRKLGERAARSFEEFERVIRRHGEVEKLLQRALPTLRAETLVRTLLTDPRRLDAASEGLLDDDERALLRRRAPKRGTWSLDDLALLDEAEHRLTGDTPSFGHVIVDEAQDLSPMQLRMVGRRAAGGSLTLLGDIAQATGAAEYEDWGGVLAHLVSPDEARVEELRLAYRVPREIMELALPLLPLIAPQVEPPVAYREAGEPPVAIAMPAERLLPAALGQAVEQSGRDGTTAVIAADTHVAELHRLREEAGLDRLLELGPAFGLYTPAGVKGLEFDRVVLVEPAAILAEAPSGRGLRELYVALTRATRTLALVHSQPLPEPLRAALEAAAERPG
jgi:DNA helicase IV